jgi:anthranilate synthase/aminodeoxychorismate synthase-like glutamine amidotransferase
VIDNYDSFVYNLVQYLGEEGAHPIVVRNDKISLEDLPSVRAEAILISPGPGHPKDAKISNDLFRHAAGDVPILGVCLGQQCFAYANGASVVRATTVMHGKTSEIHHDERGVFANIPNPVVATRYHSLVVDPATVPKSLEVSATTSDGLIMGLRHVSLPIETVQFHPESILTEHGHTMIRNFLAGFSR